jgi:hypothetical protein
MPPLPRLLLSLTLLLAPLARAGASGPAAALCQAAIAQAEREANIPPRLLAAIGRVESGRRDPQTGQTAPWPWTINAEGQGSFFPDRAAAIAAVRSLQAQGVRSIDIGCMQINLRHHPNAFASLEEAFEPLANARYAARFLTELHATRGDWLRSAAHYHSQTPEHAEAYRARIVAAWEAERGAPAAPGYAAALRAHGSFGTIGSGAAMLTNMPQRGGALLPMAGGARGGRGLDAYRAQPILVAGRAGLPMPVFTSTAPPRQGAATPQAAAGMPVLAAPGLGLSAPGGSPAASGAGGLQGLPAPAPIRAGAGLALPHPGVRSGMVLPPGLGRGGFVPPPGGARPGPAAAPARTPTFTLPAQAAPLMPLAPRRS